jgi:aconitate hydratase
MNGRQAHDRVSFDINPTSRQILENLADMGLLSTLIRAGARLHQAGCNGCIGMGQAPATGRISLRTVPRNFPGRSGTKEDAVYLVSPETAAASALTGQITDPRRLDMDYPRFEEPETVKINTDMLLRPSDNGEEVELEKGPNIKPMPDFEPLPDTLSGPVLMAVGDGVSTDEIMPAGSRVLPFRSNIPAISQFVFDQIDESYPERAMKHQETGHFIVAGHNYGQGSSREHAAIAPRYLGLHAVIALSFARIHWQNLANYGILPLTFVETADLVCIEQGDELELPDVRQKLEAGEPIVLVNKSRDEKYQVEHNLSDQQVQMILAGSRINLFRQEQNEK